MLLNEEYFIDTIPERAVRQSIVRLLNKVDWVTPTEQVSIQYGVGKMAIFKVVNENEYQFLGIIG